MIASSISSLRTEMISLAQAIRVPSSHVWRTSYLGDSATSQETLKLAFTEAEAPEHLRSKIFSESSQSLTEQEIQAAIEVVKILRKWRDEDRALGLIDW
jgi:hypothetical protein